MKVLVADRFGQAGLDGLRALGAEVVHETGTPAAPVGEQLRRANPEVLVVRSTRVDRAAMERAPALRWIIRAGAGVDNIDMVGATALGVGVANCPGMNSVAVAELTIGHLIACDRRIPDQTAELRAGSWNKKEYSKARGLKGMTLGVVGIGSIGREVVTRAKAFGMEIAVWSIELTPAMARDLGVRFGGTDRAALLRMVAECDAVTVHVALVPETRKMCDAAFFGAMKKGAYFVNTSRGGVVDESALAEAVRSKGIRCGLDVFEGQPAAEGPWKTTLTDLKGCSFTHHCGASTDQAQAAIADEVVRMVRVLMETGTLDHCVNPGATRGAPSPQPA